MRETQDVKARQKKPKSAMRKIVQFGGSGLVLAVVMLHAVVGVNFDIEPA